MQIDIDKVHRRVEKMSEGEMLDWLESAIPGMQRHLDMYRRTKNKDHFGELAIAEIKANILVTELLTRIFPEPVVEAAPVDGVPEEEETSPTTSARKSFLRPRRAKTGTALAPSEDTR